MKRLITITASFCVLSAFATLISCQAGNDPLSADDVSFYQVASQKDNITLSWETPSNKPGDSTDLITMYRIYYRKHDQGSWVLYDSVNAGQGDTCTIKQDRIGKGNFDFAICSIGNSGDASAMHSSLDQNAEPSTGWYLAWN